MAIIIPSKSIYQLNNPKVRDNIINKVFVDKTIVKPDNDYKVSVYNEDYTIENLITESDNQTEFVDATALNSGGTSIRYVRGACGLEYTAKYFTIPSILIPKAKNNKVVSKIYDEIDDKGNSDIKISIKATQKLYEGNIPYIPQQNVFAYGVDDWKLLEEKDLFSITEFDINNDVSSKVSIMQVTEPYSLESNHFFTFSNSELKIGSKLYVDSRSNWTPNGYMNINVNKSINTAIEPFNAEEVIIDGIEYYRLPQIKVFVGLSASAASCLMESTEQIVNSPVVFELPATRLTIEPEQITITVYGNTIGISLSNTSGAYGTGSKPYTIDRNELIQDGGMSGGFNLSSHLSAIIRRQYEKGKETATLTCSINDYYDSNNNLIVSPKSDQKMLFEIYDKVVPMVRQSYGVDAPMSLTSENYAKVFEVVGVRVYYDGAVWQELTLKEFNESANIQIQLPAPTIRIADDILYIQDGSGLGKSFQIYVDGNAQVITDSKTYPISNLPSITQGSHSIYVVSLGYGNYTSSNASNAVTYVKKVPLDAPTISIIDGTLIINDISGKADQFIVYANESVIAYAFSNTLNLKPYITQEGTYKITVTAYADGYSTSAMSNEVYFTRIVPLDSPSITLIGKTVNIKDNSNKADAFYIYINEVKVISTDQTVVDLSSFFVKEGNYQVYATAIAAGYDESAKSNTENYVIVPLSAPNISLYNKTITLTDTSGNAEQFNVYVNNELILTTPVSQNVIDLSNYILKEGNYEVYATVLATNYNESAKSKTVTVSIMMDVEGGYLTFVGNDTFILRGKNYWDAQGGKVYYSTDAITWNEWNGKDITSSADNRVYLRGRNNTVFYNSLTAGQAILRFLGNATEIACYGNLANLLDYAKVAQGSEITMAKNCFRELFYKQTQLTRCPEMPMTTLAEYCYYQMFYGCTSLNTLPNLPATKMQNYCYTSMFENCTSIKIYSTQSDDAPNKYRIPSQGVATNTSATGYRANMFKGTSGDFNGSGSLNIIGVDRYTPNEIV